MSPWSPAQGPGSVRRLHAGSAHWDGASRWGGRREELLAKTASEVVDAGGQCLAHRLDVTDPESVDRFYAATESAFGTVSVLINNAAMARYGPLEEFEPGEIAAEISTKLVGSLYMARRAIPGMRREMVGDLLFITSSAGVQPWPFHLPYAAANAGVEHAVRTLRLELEGSGIRASVLRCGETGDTDFATRELEAGRMGAVSEYWFRRGLLRHTGLMTPDMVADAVAAAVTLPRPYGYEIIAVTPMAPIGELPATFEAYGEAMLRGLEVE